VNRVLEKKPGYGNMLICVTIVEMCDTTTADSSNAARQQKIKIYISLFY
jgi:hypothetical protein